MQLSFREKGLTSFDAAAVALEANDMSAQYGEVSAVRIVALDISHNSIQSFSGGRFLPSLEFLDASSNLLRSAMHLPTSLTRLNISCNQLESLVGLESLSRLQTLECQQNNISSLGVLPASLQSINASDNSLDSTDGFAHLFRVTKLSLHNNKLKSLVDIASLGAMKSLRHVTLSGNGVMENPKAIATLTGAISKLTTLDGLTLSQAQSSNANRMRTKKLHDVSITARSRAAKLSRSEASREGTMDAVLEQEIRSMEARVRELERLAKEQYEAEAKARKEHALVKQQLQRTTLIGEEQARDMDRLKETMSEEQCTLEALERTLESLEVAFERQHASLVAKRLER